MTSAAATPRRAPRTTKQRAAVEAAMDALPEFISAQELHDVLREDGNRIGLATVYRALQAMADADEVDTLRTEEGETLYRRCKQDEHHHHLVCRACRHTVEVDGPGVSAWAEKLAAEHGFTQVDHTLELMGLCAQCTNKQDA